jgi:glucokinase
MTQENGPSRPLVIGLDLGGTKMLGLLMDDQANILKRVRLQTPGGGNTALSHNVLDLISELRDEIGDQARSLIGISIGAPGFIHQESGTILDAQNMQLHNLPLSKIVSETFGLTTRVIHDVKAAAFGEACFGAGKGMRHLAFMNIGTGIAVGLIFDGQIYQGSAGRSGEIGHIRVVRDGPDCSCGGRGCLEAIASGPSLVRRAQAVLSHNRSTSSMWVSSNRRLDLVSAEMIAEAARSGESWASALIEETADYLGLSIAGLINVLDLEHIIIGGGLSQMGDLLLNPIRKAVNRYVLSEYIDIVRILPSALGMDAGAIGAAAFFFRHPTNE